jgi:chemotaxis protein histidine kinase CheA
MSQAKPYEIINPPNKLKAKTGSIPAANPEAIKRAEEALEQVKSEFRDWLAEEVRKLERAHADVHANGLDGEHGEALFVVAHDLRGLGATYEFPIVTRLAASMCKLIESAEKRAEVPRALVDAHVGAIRAALIQNIRSDTDMVGRELVEELERQVIARVGADG